VKAIRNRAVQVFSLGIAAFFMWEALETTPASATIPRPPTRVTLQPPEADASLDQNSPNLNRGLEIFLKVVSWDDSRREEDNWRIVVRFDLSGIPAGSTINFALLQLCLDSISGNQSTRLYDAHQVTTHWAEGTVTYNFPWITQGGDFDPVATDTALISKLDPGASNPNRFVTWDVTNDVQAFVTTTANNGWLIKDRLEGDDPRYTTRWVSKDNSATVCPGPNSRPRLIVDFN
jgi:hypothetical protein